MLSLLLPPTLVGLLGGALLGLGMVAAFAIFVPFMLLKVAVPLAPWRRACTDVLFAIVRLWGAYNHVVCRLLYPVQWELDVRGTYRADRSYLLLANHQSWIDILLVLDQMRARVAPLCFFLKRELLWVPIIGVACWAMDFPFMRRHTREVLERHPELRDEDLETTRRFCERFRDRPVTVVNFAEGTRGTERKRIERQSPYRHLLRPKAAGVAYTLNAMGDQFDGIIDVTIAYRPTEHPLLWSFLIGEQTELAIHIDRLPIPPELMAGDYRNDPAFRERIQAWLNGIWAQKDARLERLITRQRAPAPRPRTT